MKLYIVRHGETVWNRHHKVQGVADIPLAENGILLAEKTGEALKNVSFDLCITSPLVRARKTAELILAKQAHKVPVKEDIRIREINFGVLEGVVCMNDAREYLDPQMKKFFTDPWNFDRPKDGESIRDVLHGSTMCQPFLWKIYTIFDILELTHFFSKKYAYKQLQFLYNFSSEADGPIGHKTDDK